MPSFRKPLEALAGEWMGCKACSLGESRLQVNGAFVFGEGALGSVMFIGEGPGKDEEAQGRPFVGDSGQFLRELLKNLSFDSYYLTNAVCCRSWDFQYDTQGGRQTRRNWKTKEEEYIVRDEPPKPMQCAACRPRLLEQIYIVDPPLIVTLGAIAAEALLKRSVKILSENGELTSVSLPGAGYIPQRTPKGAWARLTGPKGNRTLIAPNEQNTVTYPVIPILHPAHALANYKDQRMGAPLHSFMNGLRAARRLYEAYYCEVTGGPPRPYDETDQALYNALGDNDD